MNSKIQRHHLERSATVYVRQSSPGQALNHRESALRQRALADRAAQLGWAKDRIDILEETPRTASSTQGRGAYQVVFQNILDKRVGVILGVDVARWSRDGAAFQLLLRNCMFHDVLLADEQHVYDPNDSHDYVLLGVQGVLAEYELKMMRQRMSQCWWNKAKRCELFNVGTIGYVNLRDGREKHPDQRVRHSLERLFERFRQSSSVLSLCRDYWRREETLPFVRHGDDPYHVKWLPANYKRLLHLLKNPAYAGAYVLGQSETVVEQNEAGELIRRRVALPRDQWKVVEKDCFAPYISWRQFEENLAKIENNTTMNGKLSRPTGRHSTLLSGLLRCARCGHELAVRYGSGGSVNYLCRGGGSQRDRGEKCLSFTGRYAEAWFSQLVLEAVRPGAVEAAVRAAELLQSERLQDRQGLLDHVMQCQYEADRAKRQYDQVDPENRLVAGELESRWNASLLALATAQQRLQRFDHESSPLPAQDELDCLSQLSDRLAEVWDAADADGLLKKQVVSLVVEQVMVELTPSQEEVILWIQWTGGHHSELRVPRTVRAGRRSGETKRLIESLRQVCGDAQIAQTLNRQGARLKGASWTADRVAEFRQQHNLAAFDRERKSSLDLLTASEAADRLSISAMSVHRLVGAGVLPAEQAEAGFPCVIRGEDLEREPVREAARRIRCNSPRPLPENPSQLKLF